MAVQTQDGRRIIVFNLKDEGVDPLNWQRLANNIRSRSSVHMVTVPSVSIEDAYVERGNRPNVVSGLLRVYPDLHRVPTHKHDAALQALDEVIASLILHRVQNPARHKAGMQLIEL